MDRNPLGKSTHYGAEYDPGLLFAVPRIEARQGLELTGELPFSGVDIWNAWELTWLDATGKPVVATAELRVSANSPNIVESKSLKLYLNSLAMTRFPGVTAVEDLLGTDLTRTAGATVQVDVCEGAKWPECHIQAMPGTCIDDLELDYLSSAVDADLLQVGTLQMAQTELHSNILRSNCPVTNQPDSGSLLVRYRGREILPHSLLAYIASYRQHNGFHEACVENIFVDILRRCEPASLTVYAQYNRRGGLDINPFRSNFQGDPVFERRWRQ